MASNPKTLAAVMIAAGLAVGTVATHEGLRTRGYRDPAPSGYATICYGKRDDSALGKTYTADQCLEMLGHDLVGHGLAIADCLPEDLPPNTRAAFISFGYNVGPGALCRSTLARKARAGDLAGACNEMTRWIFAGDRVLPGLVKRRQAERSLCLSGLA